MGEYNNGAKKLHGSLSKREIAREVFKKLDARNENGGIIEHVVPILARRKKKPMTEKQILAAVEAFFEEISLALACGDRVELRGFGSMMVRKRGAKIGRNPRTNELVNIPEKGWLHFRSSRELLKMIKTK